MLCPNCRLTMRVTETAGGKIKEYYCGGCGHKKTEKLGGDKAPFMDSSAARTLDEVEDQIREEIQSEKIQETSPQEKDGDEDDLEPNEKKAEVFEEKTELFDPVKVEKLKESLVKSAQKLKEKQPESVKEEVDEKVEEEQKKQPEDTTFTRKIREDKAKKITEIRQLSRDLKSRLNDLQIQIDRRVDEVVELAEKLHQKIEEDI